MAKPAVNPPVSLLKEKYQLIDGIIYEKMYFGEQMALFLPNTFIRGEYKTLYLAKGLHLAYHRAVWMLSNNCSIPYDANGELYLVDHFDGDKMNNMPWNLRLVTQLENRNNLGHKVFFIE